LLFWVNNALMKKCSSTFLTLFLTFFLGFQALKSQINYFRTHSDLSQTHFADIYGAENENIVSTPTGYVVAGSAPGTNKLAIAKLDLAGNFLSATSYDLLTSGIMPGYTFDEFPRVLKATADGGFLVGGTMRYFYAPTGFEYRGFLIKVNASLNFVWGLDLNPFYTTQNHVSDIRVLNSGDLLVGLYSFGTHCSGCSVSSWKEYRILVNSSGSTVNDWQTSLCQSFGATFQKQDGSVWFAAQEGGSCAGTSHYMCLRWASAPGGNFTGKTYYQGMSGGPYFIAWPASMVRMRDNKNFLISGVMNDGGYRPFVMKTDSVGNPVWTKKFVITGGTFAQSTLFKAYQLPGKDIVLAGANYIVRLDSLGNFLSSGTLGYTMVDMIVNSNDQVVILSNATGAGTGVVTLDSSGVSCDETAPPAVSAVNINIVVGSNYTSFSSLSSAYYNTVTPATQVAFTSVTTTQCESFPPCTIAADFTPSDTEFCVGDTLYVTNNSVGGTTFEWYVDGFLTSTQQTPSFPMNVAGTRQVLLVVQNGICVDSFLTAVTTFPIPSPVLSASGTISFCEGDTVQLHATSAGGSLQWYEGAVAIAGATGSTLVIDSAGVFSVVETSSQGCVGSSANQLTVTVNPNPVAGFTFSTNNGTVSFTNTSSGGSASSWIFGDGNISTTSSPTHSYSASGTYTVCLTETSQNGCEDTVCQSVQVIIVGFVDGNAISISVAPNPVRDEVMVRLSQSLTEDASITVTDLAGKQVLTGRIASGESQEKIQLKGVGKGIYLLVVRGGGLDQTIKLIVE